MDFEFDKEKKTCPFQTESRSFVRIIPSYLILSNLFFYSITRRGEMISKDFWNKNFKYIYTKKKKHTYTDSYIYIYIYIYRDARYRRLYYSIIILWKNFPFYVVQSYPFWSVCMYVYLCLCDFNFLLKALLYNKMQCIW